jgi:hypothetical protein
MAKILARTKKNRKGTPQYKRHFYSFWDKKRIENTSYQPILKYLGTVYRF